MPIGDPERWNCVVLNVLCRLSFRRVSSSGWKKEGKEREREREDEKRKGEKRRERGRLEQLKWGDGDGGGGGGWRLQKQCP